MCDTVIAFSNTYQSAFPGKGSAVVPFGFTISSDWVVEDIAATGATIMETPIYASGTGWYSGLGFFCTDPYGAVNPGFLPSLRDNTALSQYVAQIQVTQELQGGTAATAPWGCAGSQNVFQPTPPVTQPDNSPCPTESPIVIDTAGEGFHLTSAAAGVMFRPEPKSAELRMAWTDPKFHNGWLALPKDGKVQSLSELFGNFTPQPPSDHPNGFLALAVYDLNADGVIDARDAIYPKLRVWIDSNHDGIAQPEELHTLAELGVERISLDYRESWRQDEFGNLFHYVSGIQDADSPKDRRCYDVFLATQ